MAKHEIILHENRAMTKASAPFTGSYSSKLTKDLEAACKRIAKLSGLPAIKVQTILTGAFDEFANIEKERATRIHFDGGYVGLRLHGTFDSADAAFDPEKNSLDLAYDLDDEIRNSLAAMLNAEKTEVNLEAEGEHLKFLEGDEANYRVEVDGTTYTGNATVVETEDDFLALKIDSGVSAAWEGAPLTLTLKSRGGRATDPVQTTTAECEIQA